MITVLYTTTFIPPALVEKFVGINYKGRSIYKRTVQ